MSIASSIRILLCYAGIAWAGSEQATTIGELIQKGKLAEARSVLDQALRTQAANPQLWNLLGVVDAQEGKAAAAERAFRKAVQLAPRLESVWLNLGRLHQMDPSDKAATEKAVTVYETVLRINPASAEAHHQLALLLQWKGQFRESLAHLNRLPPEDRTRRSAIALRCTDEAALGNTAPALDLAGQLLNDPELQEDDVFAILPAITSRNEPVALRLLEGLDARRLATARTLTQLAGIYERRGEFQRARDTYEKVVQGAPSSVPALLDVARIAWRLKDYEGVLSYLAHARDLDPDNAGIHFSFGVTCNEMSLPVEAKKSLEKAVALAPDNPYYNYAMGAVLLQWSDKAQAIPFFKKFIAAEPKDARGHLALATVYFNLYDLEHARAELALPLQNPRTRPGAEYLRGRIAAQEDDLDTAIAHFRQLLKLEPKSPEGHAELGSALFEKQDAEGARRESELALSLDADNYLANRTLLRVFQLSRDPRVNEQTERLKKLIANSEERSRLLQRTIEVRPW